MIMIDTVGCGADATARFRAWGRCGLARLDAHSPSTRESAARFYRICSVERVLTETDLAMRPVAPPEDDPMKVARLSVRHSQAKGVLADLGRPQLVLNGYLDRRDLVRDQAIDDEAAPVAVGVGKYKPVLARRPAAASAVREQGASDVAVLGRGGIEHVLLLAEPRQKEATLALQHFPWLRGTPLRLGDRRRAV
jgi:hypothetical protein